MYETPQKNLSLTLQMTEISDIYPSNFGQWYHPRGSITIFVIYQFELGMTQRLIWHMTQVSATKSFVGTTQTKCGWNISGKNIRIQFLSFETHFKAGQRKEFCYL